MTATCTKKVAELACGQTGVAFLCSPWNAADTSLCVQAGQGDNFPTPTAGTSFWMDIGGCGCCTRVEVTARTGDNFTIVPTIGAACACVRSNSRVSYAANAPETIRALAQELGINVLPPLRYNCATRTLSIDCEELKQMVALPCGI